MNISSHAVFDSASIALFNDAVGKPSEALGLCFKLARTLCSIGFEKSLSKPWSDEANVAIIQRKATSDLSRAKRFHWDGGEGLSKYLSFIQGVCKVPVLRSQSGGAITRLSADDYRLVDSLIVNATSLFPRDGEFSRLMFDANELLRCLINYFLIKDSIRNGTNNKKLDDLIDHLIKTKPGSFFLRGYVCDLFVYDRLAIDAGPVAKLFCNRDYLSTRFELDSTFHNADGWIQYNFESAA